MRHVLSCVVVVDGVSAWCLMRRCPDAGARRPSAMSGVARTSLTACMKGAVRMKVSMSREGSNVVASSYSRLARARCSSWRQKSVELCDAPHQSLE